MSTLPQDAGQDEARAGHHEHVRTDGEIGVDDALGAADEPEADQPTQ